MTSDRRPDRRPGIAGSRPSGSDGSGFLRSARSSTPRVRPQWEERLAPPWSDWPHSFLRIGLPRNQRVDQLKVSALVPSPTVARHILVRVPDHRFTKLRVGKHFVHRLGEFLVITRLEKTHNGFV